MTVFVAASDETSGGNALSMFHYAGWIAPEPDWSLYFAPAWQWRVLDGPPKIEYLHMTDMRSRAWREQQGITQTDADDRLDEAARVIDQLGTLCALNITIDAGVFRPLYRKHKMLAESGGAKTFEPDFLGFVAYAYAVLLYVHKNHPNAEKVDFLVEDNASITKCIHQLYKTMPDSLRHIGHPELAPLLGEFIPGGKDSVPLQAADYLCWHVRRAAAQTLTTDRDLRRWGTISTRSGFSFTMPKSTLTALSEAFTKRGAENEAANRIRNVRQNRARSDERIARRDKKGTTRRTGSKNTKKAEG